MTLEQFAERYSRLEQAGILLAYSASLDLKQLSLEDYLSTYAANVTAIPLRHCNIDASPNAEERKEGS